MEVVKLCSAPVCNSEVVHFLREKKNLLPTKKKAVHGSQAATVVLETLNHLEKFESTTDLTPERVDSFQKRLEENNLQLSDREKLHLINLCPTTLVEIQVLIDDSEERFSEDQFNLLLDIVQSELLGAPGDLPEEGANSDSPQGSHE